MIETKKKIALFATGGTISMLVDEKLKAASPALKGQDLLGMLAGRCEVAEVSVFDFAHVGSSQITPAMIAQLAARIDTALAEGGFDAALVTQGSDTVEETAYLADLLLRTDRPVVFTAAMRNNSELGQDGPRNLCAALLTAASEAAAGQGVLVVANDEVFAAVDVQKVHTLNNAAFAAPGSGPLGYVLQDKQCVVFVHASRLRERLHPEGPVPDLVASVPILKFAMGMEPALASAALEAGAAGLVLEGAGAGNFPPGTEAIVEAAVARGVPVVLTSRCGEGFVADIYGYAGAGRALTERGAILGQGLTAVKARMKLLVLLDLGWDMARIRAAFEYLY